MKRQSGFTLIELIIVIVILGILAVTAAPQFFNFGGDARASTVRNMESSVKSAADLVYARAAIQGIENNASVAEDGDNAVTVNNRGIATVYGYPAASADGIIRALNANIVADDADDEDLERADWVHNGGTGGVIQIRPRGQTGDCFVAYTQAQGTAEEGMTNSAQITANVSGC